MSVLVSIISPCYNNEKFIEQTIKSVLSQTYSNWEMLIVDDCSTDKSFEIAKKYALQDSRIKVFKNDNNSGAAYSRNVALDKAKGKYVAFLDSDDLWEPEKLERQVMFMQDNNCDFCFSKYRLIDEKGISLNKVAKVPAKINYYQLKHHDFIGCLTAMYDFEKFNSIRGFDLKSNNDYGLFLQVVKKANNVMGIKEVLASYRIQHNGISRKKLKKIKPFFQLFHTYLKIPFINICIYLVTNVLIGKIWKYEKENMNIKNKVHIFYILENKNSLHYLCSPIALAAKEAGYDVTILASATGRQSEITDMGLKYIELPMNTTGMNKWEELKTLRFLKKIYKTEKPDIVHHVGLKPILWGTCAARFAKIPHVVNAISGTGFLFSPEKRNSKASKAVCFLLKIVNKKSDVFIFQNHDDEKEFIKAGIIDSCQTRFIKGSGVDLNRFSYVPEYDKDNKKLKVVFTGRMIKSKGVMEFIQAAVILKQKYYEKVEFLLCGGLDSNPTALQKYELETLCDGEYIKWLGFQSNIYEILKQCHIFVFPSYYMEGLPKSIIDAQSAGLPVITTDWVGCRDTVINGENGFLVPVKDAETLAKKIDLLLEDTELRQRMGKNARYFAEQNFDINLVIKKHLEIYASFFC